MINDTRLKIRQCGDGRCKLLVLINHPMESGLRRDALTGRVVPPQYVRSLVVRLNGEPAAVAELGPAVASNPLTGFQLLNPRPGDVVSAEWIDNRGTRGRAETMVE